jgi:hypothetical protein
MEMMTDLAGHGEAVARPRRATIALAVGAVLLLTAAGLTLWAAESGSVFATYLVSTVAGCF